LGGADDLLGFLRGLLRGDVELLDRRRDLLDRGGLLRDALLLLLGVREDLAGDVEDLGRGILDVLDDLDEIHQVLLLVGDVAQDLEETDVALLGGEQHGAAGLRDQGLLSPIDHFALGPVERPGAQGAGVETILAAPRPEDSWHLRRRSPRVKSR
jgi:hypothetical protein